MSKPSWKDAPEWANWLARNDDGWWFWHELEVRWFSDGWISEGQCKTAGKEEFVRYAVEARPEPES